MRSKVACEADFICAAPLSKKPSFPQTDDQTVGIAAHGNFFALDFGGERAFQFGLQLRQIAILPAPAERRHPGETRSRPRLAVRSTFSMACAVLNGMGS